MTKQHDPVLFEKLFGRDPTKDGEAAIKPLPPLLPVFQPPVPVIDNTTFQIEVRYDQPDEAPTGYYAVVNKATKVTEMKTGQYFTALDFIVKAEDAIGKLRVAMSGITLSKSRIQ